MLSSNLYGEYKNFDFANDEILDVEHFKNTFDNVSVDRELFSSQLLKSHKVIPASFVLTDNSIIQNFFSRISVNNYVSYSYHPFNLRPTSPDIPAPKRDFTFEIEKSGYDTKTILTFFRVYRNMFLSHDTYAHCQDINGLNSYFPLGNRFTSNRNIFKLSDALHSFKGHGVFLTLTYAHDVSSPEAWKNRLSKDWNKFMSRLVHELRINPYKSKRLKSLKMDLNMRLNFFKGKINPSYPKINRSDLHFIKFVEAQGNSYPHIHALFLGIDWLFNAGNKEEYLNDNPHSKNLKHIWGSGSIFVNKTTSGENIVNPVNYLMKYLRKTFTDEDNNKGELTQSLLWAYKKRSFSVSHNLYDYLGVSKPDKSLDPDKVSLKGFVVFEKLAGQFTSISWLKHFHTPHKAFDWSTPVNDLTFSLYKLMHPLKHAPVKRIIPFTKVKFDTLDFNVNDFLAHYNGYIDLLFMPYLDHRFKG